MLNIAYMFNTMVWGQVDAIHTNLLFLAVLAAFYRPVVSGMLFALALAMKPHAIIFIPILGIIWLFTFKNIGTWVKVFGVIAVTLLIVVLPFIVTGNAGKMMNVVFGAVGRYPYVSVCAFNIWYLITTINPEHTIDSETYILFGYKHWGLLMFFLSSALILVPFMFSMWRARINNEDFFKNKAAQLMLACGLIILYFFYFNTQMHERYAHGIIIFFFFYGVFSKNYKLYILASIPYFLSLDKLFPDYLPVKHIKIIWASKVIAIWYTLTVIYASWLYIREHRISREYRLQKAAWAKK
jgi:Gpi18-like mannosyltransferase